MTALRAAHSFVLVGELGGTLDFKSRLCAQPVPLRKTGVTHVLWRRKFLTTGCTRGPTTSTVKNG